MDNFRFDITWEGEHNFRSLVKLFVSRKCDKVTHYEIDPDYGMILYWTKPSRPAAMPVPYPMGVDGAVDFVWNWLKTADYQEEPDHDGDNGRGWRIFNEDWGHVKGEWAATIAIQPCWAMYGK